MNKKQFSKTILNYRKKHNLTQEGLADMFGLSRFSIMRWEQETCYPRKSILMFLKSKNVIE